MPEISSAVSLQRKIFGWLRTPHRFARLHREDPERLTRAAQAFLLRVGS